MTTKDAIESVGWVLNTNSNRFYKGNYVMLAANIVHGYSNRVQILKGGYLVFEGDVFDFIGDD